MNTKENHNAGKKILKHMEISTESYTEADVKAHFMKYFVKKCLPFDQKMFENVNTLLLAITKISECHISLSK